MTALSLMMMIFSLIIAGLLGPATNANLLPVPQIKLPKKIHDVSYKGSVFSYSTNTRDPFKTLRDFALETEEVKSLEESFVDHFTDIVLNKLSNDIKNGIPVMAIPPLDPLRLNAIRVEPHIGSELFTINLNNVEIEGLADVDVQDVRPRLNALKVRIALIFPKMAASCHFRVNGTLYGVIDVRGEGEGRLEYTDVVVRTQLNLAHENKTFRVVGCDPPLVDFSSSKIMLSHEDGNRTRTGMASELGPLLFWVFADHIVQEIDDYLLKYVNKNLLLFKVPETFRPPVTWLVNKNGPTLSSASSNQVPMLSPFPFLNQWFKELSSFKPTPPIRFFK